MQSSGTSYAASSGEPFRHSCICCHGRMSSFSLDRHTYCYKCRGSDCDMNNKCDKYVSWTKEEMEAYFKLRKSVMSESRHCKSVSKSSSPPRSSAPLLDLDIDDRFQSQLDSINKVLVLRLQPYLRICLPRLAQC